MDILETLSDFKELLHVLNDKDINNVIHPKRLYSLEEVYLAWHDTL